MDRRIELHDVLKTITPNVYFQPPTNISIQYPAIIYSRKDISKVKANNKTYKMNTTFDLMVVDRNPDSPIAAKLLELDYCEFDRQYSVDGINHISLIINY